MPLETVLCTNLLVSLSGDWQFFPPRLLELQELEANYNKVSSVLLL